MDVIRFLDTHPSVLGLIISALVALVTLNTRLAVSRLRVTMLQELRRQDERWQGRIDRLVGFRALKAQEKLNPCVI